MPACAVTSSNRMGPAAGCSRRQRREQNGNHPQRDPHFLSSLPVCTGSAIFTGSVLRNSTCGAAFSGARSGPAWQPTHTRCSPRRAQNQPFSAATIFPADPAARTGWASRSVPAQRKSRPGLPAPGQSLAGGHRPAPRPARWQQSPSGIFSDREVYTFRQSRFAPCAVAQPGRVALGNGVRTDKHRLERVSFDAQHILQCTRSPSIQRIRRTRVRAVSNEPFFGRNFCDRTREFSAGWLAIQAVRLGPK